MKYPIQDYISTSKEMLTNFQGYDNRLACLEGSFFDEKNATTDHYPILSPRDKRVKALGDIPYSPDNVAETKFKRGGDDYNADRILNTSDGSELISILCDSIGTGKEEEGVWGSTTGLIEPALVYGKERILTKSNGLGKNLLPGIIKGYWENNNGVARLVTTTDASTKWCCSPTLIEIPKIAYEYYCASARCTEQYKLYVRVMEFDENRHFIADHFEQTIEVCRISTNANTKYVSVAFALYYKLQLVDSPQQYITECQLEKGSNPTKYEEYSGDLNFHMFANREHQLIRMGSKLVIFPERLWVGVDGTEKGKFGTLDDYMSCYMPVITVCNQHGEPINWESDEYYTETDAEGKLIHPPKSGDYMITTNANGQDSIKVYSDLTKAWSTVTTTYVSIRVRDTDAEGSRIREGDGITVMSYAGASPWSSSEYETVSYLDQLFVNEEKNSLVFRSLFDVSSIGNGKSSLTNGTLKSFTAPVKKVIKKDGYTYFVVTGFIKSKQITIPDAVGFGIKRAIPDMAFVVECQNRLWGCSRDGHEIYCSKLGDPTNWNYFTGTAMDSYVATVGSSGKFTGATVYNQNPIFFKENSYIKVSVSASGAHSYREQDAESVAMGSHRSIVNVEGALYYLSSNGVYAFDGSMPQKVSESLGKHRYENGIASRINGKYYISAIERDESVQGDISRKDVLNGKAKHVLLVFDTLKGVWTKEDGETYLITDMYSKDDTLYMNRYQKNGTKEWYETWMTGVPCYLKRMKTDNTDFFYGDKTKPLEYTSPVEGDPEKVVDWFVESPPIGYAISNNKYVGKINIRMSLAIGAYADFWMKYDNDSEWQHIFNMSGKGTKSFTIPVTPRRCDTFKYKISGKGDCKVISVTKSIEEGSDV